MRAYASFALVNLISLVGTTLVETDRHAQTLALPPVVLASSGTLPTAVHLTGAMATLAYQASLDHPNVLRSVPGTCGCVELLAHRNNLDCYIEARDIDGQTAYSTHGLYCGVCQLITRDAVEGAKEGMTTGELRTMILERYGS